MEYDKSLYAPAGVEPDPEVWDKIVRFLEEKELQEGTEKEF